uniref:Gustatory receptor n=1 Tax=Parastrongyloides trichosuri TaxID=131310 RepID=A0A0N4ZLT3_PARTI
MENNKKSQPSVMESDILFVDDNIEKHYGEEFICKEVYFPIYWLVNFLGLPTFQTQKKSGCSKLLKLFLTLITIGPIIAFFIYNIVLTHHYQILSLHWAHSFVYNTLLINAILGVIMYNGIQKFDFFKTFIIKFKDYREMDTCNRRAINFSKTSAMIKILILWIVYISCAIITCTINYTNYEINEEKKITYKISKFFNKQTFFLDTFIIIFANILTLFFISLYLCTYWAIQGETSNFSSQAKRLLDQDCVNARTNLISLSMRHTKLMELVSFVNESLDKYTNILVFHSILITVFSISVVRNYSLAEIGGFEKFEVQLPILLCILVAVFILSPIASSHDNILKDKNTILFNNALFHPYNAELHSISSSMIQRIESATYTGRLVHLIPVNELILPIVVLATIFLSILVGIAPN